MLAAPYVPSDLQTAIIKLAQSISNRAYINVVSEGDQLAICVSVRYRVITNWKVHTWGMGVYEKVAELHFHARYNPARLGKTMLMFEWNGSSMTNVPMCVDPEMA